MSGGPGLHALCLVASENLQEAGKCLHTLVVDVGLALLWPRPSGVVNIRTAPKGSSTGDFSHTDLTSRIKNKQFSNREFGLENAVLGNQNEV